LSDCGFTWDLGGGAIAVDLVQDWAALCRTMMRASAELSPPILAIVSAGISSELGVEDRYQLLDFINGVLTRHLEHQSISGTPIRTKGKRRTSRARGADAAQLPLLLLDAVSIRPVS
jgi:hypothetical protein